MHLLFIIMVCRIGKVNTSCLERTYQPERVALGSNAKMAYWTALLGFLLFLGE